MHRAGADISKDRRPRVAGIRSLRTNRLSLPLLLIALLSAPLGRHTAAAQGPVPRIVNGVTTQAFPEVGELMFLVDGRLEPSCSATLIGCRTVLTAAHCFCGPELTASECQGSGFLEFTRVSQVFVLQHGGRFSLDEVILHPQYVFGESADIAVVHLGQDVEGIPPATINTVARPSNGTSGTIVGFGVTDALEADAGVKRRGGIILGNCQGLVPASTHLCWTFNQPFGPPGIDSNTCFGDSGGPLFVDLAGSARLAGITSGGVSDSPDCRDDLSFDTDVFVYRDWVQSTAGSDLGRSCGNLAPIGTSGAQVRTAEGQLSFINERLDLSFEVPPNTLELRVVSNGTAASPGIGAANDFALAVRRDRAPTLNDADCIDTTPGAAGVCRLTNPSPGTWHAEMFWQQGFGTAQLTASIFGPSSLPGTPAPTFTPSATAPATTTPSSTRTRTAAMSSDTPTPTSGTCSGDCDGNGAVTIDEVVTGITIGLGQLPLLACTIADFDGDGKITVDELIKAIDAALKGCRSAPATPLPTRTATRSATPTATPRGTCDGAILDAVRLTGSAGTRGPSLSGVAMRDRDLVLPAGATVENLELELITIDKRGLLSSATIGSFGTTLRLLSHASEEPAVEAQLSFRHVSPVLRAPSAIAYPLPPPASFNPAAMIAALSGAAPADTTQEIEVQMQVGSFGTGTVYFVAELRAVGRCEG